MQEYEGQRPETKRHHYDGFAYRRDNPMLLRVAQFRCCKSKCPGRARYALDTPDHVIVTKCHNHARDYGPFQTFKLRKELKERAAQDLTSKITTIFQEVCRKYPNAATLVCPEKQRRRMRRIRRDLLPTKIPNTYSDLADVLNTDELLKDKYAFIDPKIEGHGREKFFLKKIVDSNGKVSLVFSTDDLLQTCLKTSLKIKVDSTFKTLSRKPSGRQLFSIHACHGTHAFPICVVLMESKSVTAYREIFKFIKEKVPGWQPDEVVTDFEAMLRKAVKKEFPSAEVTGCYFHYTQAIQRNWAKHGLLRLKANIKAEANKFKDTLMALPFAKEEDIPLIYETLDDNMSLALRRKLLHFMKYFEGTWLSENEKNFKPEDYCVYGKPDRTNNHVESFHSTLHDVHPNIWRLLEILSHKIIEGRQNFGRFNNGIDISAALPVKIVYNDARIASGRLLYEAGRIKPIVFVQWCRTSIKNTLAVVRQGRRLRRLLKAEDLQVEYDDVETSDYSMDSEYDFEYEPNPYLEQRMAREDRADMEDWQEAMQSDHSEHDENEFQGDLSDMEDKTEGLQGENGNAEDEDIPSDNDNIWDLPEDEELQLLEASQIAEEAEENVIPFEVVPSILPSERESQSCISCFSNQATVLVLPCRHALLCKPCSDLFFEEKCPKCSSIITERLDFYAI